ncbi:MAG: EAL domain-containing protein [Neorhizobium sp.]|nr:EAL domain-containing protein [Neorhizobium sp.]
MTSSLFAFAIVVTLVTVFILTALDRIADFANRQDDARSRETTVGALHTFQEQLHATLNDYAAWDDAAQFVYAGDQAWTVSNYGDMTVNSDLFDVAVVMDAKRRVLMAYQDGKPVNWTPDSYFDSSLWTLFDLARTDRPDASPEQVGFTRTHDGVAATGVALIRMKSGMIDKPAGERLFLIFARHLDARKVAVLETTYNVSGLRFAEGGEVTKNIAEIRNLHGLLLSRLTWASRLPGDLGYREVRPLVYGALAMVGLFFLLLFINGTNRLSRLTADEAAARQLAVRDRLSGLLNRSGLFGSLEEMVAQAGGKGQHVALLYLDLDGFKEVNDAYGHGTGDQLIRGVAAGLKALVGGNAQLARVGGDEFAIAICGDDPLKDAGILSDRILGFFDEPFVIGERVATVGTSIGIAASPRGKVSGDELVRRADMAMYRAKENGRGRAEYYHPDMDAEREVRNQLELDLRIAIERRELTIVYQPVVSANSWRLVGVEALVRWERKGYGPVPPEVFIPIAESTGLIDQLGLFVLHRACETGLRWEGLKIAVNVSPGQFRDPAFALHVQSVFRKTGMDPARVTLEMTEGYFIQNPARARAAIAKLRHLGVSIALDDFGAGFSSIGYLRQFGFDRMKIDKSLVKALEEGGRSAEAMQATVALAKALDMPVTAEGVENENLARQLQISGCDELQGYFFGQPMSVEEMDRHYFQQPGSGRTLRG